jgi:hypothetical protein
MSRVLIALLAALLVGAAVTNKAEAQGWTCTYDFSTGQQGWTVESPASYSGGAFVHGDSNWNPYYARTVYINSPTLSGTTTAITVTFNRTVGTFTTGNDIGSMDIRKSGGVQILAVNPGDGPTSPAVWTGSATTTSLRIGIVSSSRTTPVYDGSIAITKVVVSGTGTQPTNCPQATPTPTPIPPTATNTPIPPTATNTPLPTSTGVPYPTAAPFVGGQGDSYWGNTYNMAYGLQGWSLISGMIGAGRVVSADVSGTQRLEMEYPLGNVRLTDFFANYEANCAHTFEVKDGNTVFESGSVGSGMQALVWQGDHVVANGSVRLSLVGSAGCGVSAFQLTEITLMGYGTNPTNLQATAVAFNTGNIWGGLQDANTMLNTLPQSFAGSVPPETGRALFGYVKWIVSPSSADEIAGPFAPVISHIGFALLIMFGAAAVYAIVWALVWILKFVVWLFKWVLTLVDLVLQIAQVIGNAIGGLLKFI